VVGFKTGRVKTRADDLVVGRVPRFSSSSTAMNAARCRAASLPSVTLMRPIATAGLTQIEVRPFHTGGSVSIAHKSQHQYVKLLNFGRTKPISSVKAPVKVIGGSNSSTRTAVARARAS